LGVKKATPAVVDGGKQVVSIGIDETRKPADPAIVSRVRKLSICFIFFFGGTNTILSVIPGVLATLRNHKDSLIKKKA